MSHHEQVSIRSRADFSLMSLSRLAVAQGLFTGCLRVSLAHPCRQLSTAPCGHVCGQSLRGMDKVSWAHVAACFWDSACLSGASFAPAVVEYWALLRRPSLVGGVGLRQPQSGDEDVACVLSLASLACGRPSWLTHHQKSSEQKGAAV